MASILHVGGARPNFVKIAPVMEALQLYDDVRQTLIHTGQHYDESLSQIFFDQLGIPRPDIDLGVGSGSHAEQTAGVMVAFERECLRRNPDLVLVVGDVNSTLACSVVAAKLGIKIGHIEAGLRSFDWSMPEEINRVVTDRLASLLFTTEHMANENLEREGVPSELVHFVGNVMIDTLLRHREQAPTAEMLERFNIEPRGYALVTLHRPSNVDRPETLTPILEGLAKLTESIPVIFPAHPRTCQRLADFSLSDRLGRVRVVEPLGYLEFLALMSEAAVVLTDSGGIQEETTVLGVPCLTLRPNTERPVTLTEGTNRLVRLDSESIVEAALEALPEAEGVRPPKKVPPLWDGKAAERIAQIVSQTLATAD